MKPSRKQFLFKNGCDDNALKLAVVSRGVRGFAFGGLLIMSFHGLASCALTPVLCSVPVVSGSQRAI